MELAFSTCNITILLYNHWPIPIGYIELKVNLETKLKKKKKKHK